MKNFKHLFFALLTSLLLTAGFAKAAESFDAVSSSSQVHRTVPQPSAAPCIIIE
jgi:hypothetical protein